MKTKASTAKKAAPAASLATLPEGVRKSIDTALIDPHPHNRKIDPKTCRGLAASMKQFGQIQPAVVRPHPTQKGRFQLGAGERRFHGAVINKTPLDCLVCDLTDAQIEGLLVIENNQRENPDARHEATQIRRFTQAHPDATPQQIAAMLGREEPWVKRRLRLLDLIEPVHEAWTDPKSALHSLSIASMELIAQLPPEQQDEFLKETEDAYDEVNHDYVMSWIEGTACRLDKAAWLDNPATFVPGCGPGCATSSAAADLFSNTEFANKSESQCAQCLNGACFKKREALARADAWQTVIAKAPAGWYAISDKYNDTTVTLADTSTLKPRPKWDFNGWTNCKKSDPAAKPFIEESNDTVKLTWKKPPADATSIPLPAGETAIKTPEESQQGSIDRLQGKRYTLVLDELRDHVEKVPLPAFKEPAITVLCLASAFGTISRLETVNGHFYDFDTRGEVISEDENATDAADNDTSSERPTPWKNFRDLNPTWHIQHLWKSLRKVLSHRLRDRSYTDRKSDLIKPEFINEMREVSNLTGFDFDAAYLRAVAATKMPAALKDLDPITLEKKQ